MTKQEKIKEAYGNAYEALKSNIDLNTGFTKVQVVARQKTDGTEYDNHGFTVHDVDSIFSCAENEGLFYLQIIFK